MFTVFVEDPAYAGVHRLKDDAKTHRTRLVACGMGAALLLSGCTSPRLPAAPAAVPAPVTAVPQEYVIGRDDQLLIHFMYNTSFDQSLTVQPDGRIALPMVGSLVASGETPSSLGRASGRDGVLS